MFFGEPWLSSKTDFFAYLEKDLILYIPIKQRFNKKMKIIIFFFFLTLSQSLNLARAGDCTDFSGNFADDYGVKVKINQTQCSSARFEYHDGIEHRAVNYIFDGSQIKVIEILGVFVNYETAIIKNSDYILINGENDFSDGHSTGYTKRILFKVEAGNSKNILLDQIGSFDPSGEFHAQLEMIYKRF